MFRKINTKWLAIIFIALLAIVVLVTLVDKKSTVNRNRTFNSELTNIDTTQVSAIYIYPKGKTEFVELTRSGEDWSVKIAGKKYAADESTIKNMLNSLVSLNATRIASKDKSKWAEYEVTDSAATRVEVKESKKVTADLYIGKFSYKQPANANPYMQQRGTLTSYVRIAGEKEVYAVEGILSMAFNREAKDFRNHTIIKSEKEKWTKLAFNRPDGNFNLVKKDNKWMVNGLVADSAAIANYFNSIAWLSNSDFIDEALVESTSPEYLLSIEGENMPQPIKVKAMKADTANMYAIVSSLNEGSFFSGKTSGLMDKIFISKNQFLPINK